METRLLTYTELGEALGIAVDSAKRLARRRKWKKQPGNDGRARVAVPTERLVRRDDSTDDREDDPADIPWTVRADTPADDQGGALEDVRGVIRSLERHVERLERSLECALQRCEAATARAAALEVEAAATPALRTTIEALRAALESERSRVADLRAER